MNLLLGCAIGMLGGLGAVLIYRRFVPIRVALLPWYILTQSLAGGTLETVVKS